MKKLILLSCFFASAVFFCSCSDTLVTPVTGEYFDWMLIDSSQSEYVYQMAQPDENTLITITNNGAYKFSGISKRRINFPDNNFRADLVKSFNEDYTIFYGYSGAAAPYYLQLNIMQGETITKINLDSISFFSSMSLAILKQGLIAASLGNRFYIYDNGNISIDTIMNNYVNSMAVTGNTIYAFTDFYSRNIYKFNNGHFNYYAHDGIHNYFVPLGSSMLGVTGNNSNYNLDYFVSSGWVPVANNISSQILYASGYDQNNFYAVIRESFTYNAKGGQWNGSSFKPDLNSKISDFDASEIKITQMKKDVFFIYGSSYPISTNYIYRVDKKAAY